MADRYFRVIASMAFDDAAPTSQAVNVWHWRSNGADTLANDATNVCGVLKTFYVAIASKLSDEIANSVRLRTYNLLDAETRVPINDTSQALGPGGVGYPNEVAICLSYRGAITSGVNRKRNRGRLYLGPVYSGAGADGTGDILVSAATRTQITGAAAALLGNLSLGLGGGIYNWSVFSRAEAGAPAADGSFSSAQLAPAFRNVAAGYVDEAFDTQRRRGRREAARTTF